MILEQKSTSYLILERKIFAEIEIVIDFRTSLAHSENGAASGFCDLSTYVTGKKRLHHLTEPSCQPSEANIITSYLKVMKQSIYKDVMTLGSVRV